MTLFAMLNGFFGMLDRFADMLILCGEHHPVQHRHADESCHRGHHSRATTNGSCHDRLLWFDMSVKIKTE
jgi:hypothetical protein